MTMTSEQLAQLQPSLDSMLRAHEAFYSTDNVRDAMLKAYRIMHDDVVSRIEQGAAQLRGSQV